MDADNRGFEESTDDMDSTGDYFHDTGPDTGEEDEFVEASGLSADAAGVADGGQEAEAAGDDTVDGQLAIKVEALSPEEAPEEVYEIDPSPHSLLSVLFPAKPPRPRNARVIRLFDLEAKADGDEAEPAVEEPPKEEPRSREAIRAARNQSLMVAARLRLE